jgi:DNA-binding IclR family transcriptional regulator
VSRLTYTLTRMGYLTYSPTTSRYALSVGVLAFHNAYLGNLDVRNVARPLMQELADGLPATVSLGAPDPSSSTWCSSRSARAWARYSAISMDVGASRAPRLDRE